MSVWLVATLDTKGLELDFIRQQLLAAGQPCTVVDASCLGPPQIAPDVSRAAVLAAAQRCGVARPAVGDRGAAVTVAAAGVTRLAEDAWKAGTLSGLLAIGGSAGATIGTAAMRALPLGVPKIMVTTMTTGNCRPFVGGKDIVMMSPVTDIAGLHRISRMVLANAAGAMLGMLATRAAALQSPLEDRPLIVASMFGVTTPCVDGARRILDAAGYEVLVFHATGAGGEAMEGLIADGLVAGVLDVTTTELADELVGGVLSAGPTRLTAAANAGVPQVVSMGALDMVNFGPRSTVSSQFAARQFHQHNANVTLMRTTPRENRQLGEIIGEKVGRSRGPAAILFPAGGVSALDAPGMPFDDLAARMELLAGLKATAPTAMIRETEHHINDAEFSAAAAQLLLQLLGRGEVL